MKQGIESRRGFLAAAAAVAAAALVACQPERGQRTAEAASTLVPTEVVALRPWMRSTTAMPDHVPAVRLLPQS